MDTVLISTPGDASLDPSFGATIYSNALEEPDRNTNDVAGLLITNCGLEKTAKQADGEAAIDSG